MRVFSLSLTASVGCGRALDADGERLSKWEKLDFLLVRG